MGTIWHRIPDTWYALAVAGTLAYIYFRWQSESKHRTILPDLAFTVPVTYLFTQRLAWVASHLSWNWHEDLLNVLTSPGQRGWIPAALLTAGVGGWTLWRKGSWNREVRATFMMGFLVGAIGYFGYYAVRDSAPYQTQDVVRIVVLTLLFGGFQRVASRHRRPYRLWGTFGTVMLTTSVMIPHVHETFGLSFSQWTFLAIMVLAIGLEALADRSQLTPQVDGFSANSAKPS